MKIITDSELTDFLSKKPLYAKILVVSDYDKYHESYVNPLDYINKPFKFKCPREKETQTFKTSVYSNYFGRYIHENTDVNAIPMEFDENTRSFNMTFQLSGICQSCGAKIEFLINAYSDKTWDERETGVNSGINIFIQKVGQLPSFEISPDKIVEKYLTDEDIVNYKKALINLSVSYGIGAYSYFRRIIENEIKRIIEDISTIDFEGVDKIKKAMESYKIDHQMSNLINVVNDFLPKSLMELGDNPIKLLYAQLSEGIHAFSDEQCLKKAELIDKVLTYVIKKVNEEKYQLLDVKEAMKKLKNGC